MTRNERAWHWRMWLIIAPLLAVLFIVALTHRPSATNSSARKPATQGAQP